MRTVDNIHDFEQIRVLADARRLKILRLLMSAPSTLTQLAQALGESPAWVRHHMLALEAAGLIQLAEVRTTGKVREKFFRARAGAFMLREMVLPQAAKPAVVFAGSDDPALDEIARRLSGKLTLLSLPVGSLEGLINLREQMCQLSGSHLLDAGGDYNVPFIRHLFPDREVLLVTLAQRTQGWMLAAGNPKGLRGIQDLLQPGVRFVNRNPGSGTRVWMDAELHRGALPPESIEGYQREVSTHDEAAALVQSGQADISLGLQAAAQAHGLDFIPLFEERYDLVLTPEHKTALLPILDYIQTREFRRALSSFAGYNPRHTGEQIHP
ncbi:MAG: substrate-binding domain-containing protein [Bacteroidota bacterium]